MQSGERKTRPGVIELPSGVFPVDAVMTLRAFGTKATIVRVLVAGRTRRTQSKKSPAQILDLDRGSPGAGNMLRRVTEIAAEARVLALQYIASLFVIEIPRLPFNQLEVASIMLGMATRALLARFRLHPVGGMQPLPGSQPLRDFGVAIETPENCLTAKLVTTGALGGAFERLMCPR
jgi:hypothetical protein